MDSMDVDLRTSSVQEIEQEVAAMELKVDTDRGADVASESIFSTQYAVKYIQVDSSCNNNMTLCRMPTGDLPS
jgi:hypothetical protein